VLRLMRATCLQRSIVEQAWRADHGDSRDVVIGVRRVNGEFAAHAWVEGDDPGSLDSWREITRLAPHR
jgi:hypothetical protein